MDCLLILYSLCFWLCDTVGGVAELAVKFHNAKPQYGLCRLGNTETGSTRIAMVNWVSG